MFETQAGFSLFKVLDEGTLSKVEDLRKEFSTVDSARQVAVTVVGNLKMDSTIVLPK